MKKLETFIFVHDQNIILHFNSINKFSELNPFKYVFLGNRPTDLIQHLDNVIITRNLIHNIEEYPKFTSLTGWYALCKNNLIDSDYVNFFEYDVNYINNFTAINKKLISYNFDFIGYFPMLITDPVYLVHNQYSDKLIQSIKDKTMIDINSTINKIISKNKNGIWASSSNSTWKTSILKQYIEWFSQFIDDIKNSDYSGHMFERSLSFYYFIMNLRVEITHGLMDHFQLNSHGTSPLPLERSTELYKMLK